MSFFQFNDNRKATCCKCGLGIYSNAFLKGSDDISGGYGICTACKIGVKRRDDDAIAKEFSFLNFEDAIVYKLVIAWQCPKCQKLFSLEREQCVTCFDSKRPNFAKSVVVDEDDVRRAYDKTRGVPVYETCIQIILEDFGIREKMKSSGFILKHRYNSSFRMFFETREELDKELKTVNKIHRRNYAIIPVSGVEE